ncbi:MAG: radical SAM family heme chaperone HemW [Acidithiobacillus sp.]
MSITLQPPSVLSLYVHLPWCKAKCPYCDFNSHVAPDTVPVERYTAALLADLERELPWIWGRRIGSIFFGGGTPSLFPPAAIDRLLSELRARLRLQPGVEISMEANPGAIETAAFPAYRDAGITRLSLGIQSFDDRLLQILGRIHDGAAARRAIAAAASAGFASFNLDLIFALPGQDLAAALADLETALAFAPPHLSLYQLTLEAGTPFAAQPPAHLPDADLAADMELALRERLETAGLHRYEISAHARTGHACQHNLNYWRYGDYLGIGAGAHGKITLPDGIWRTRKPARPESYMADALGALPQLGERECIAEAELPFEFMLNTLRLPGGVPERLFTERTGLALESILPQLLQAEADGLLQRQDGILQPSARGLDFYNDLCTRFLQPARRVHRLVRQS